MIGKSGAGKSSIVLKEITQHNKKLITDDILILTKIDGQIIAIKNIHSIGISEEDLSCHYQYLKPYLDISGKNNYQIKPRINYEKYDRAVYVDQIKIKKIIFLCEKQITASIKKIEASQAFKYLINSHKHYFNGVINFFDLFGDMVYACNCYQLNICNDVEETVKVLNNIIDNE